MISVTFGGQHIGQAVDVKHTPHRCGKNDLQPGFPEANGMRSMKCNKCHSVWHIEYRNNRVMNIFRDGVRQDY